MAAGPAPQPAVRVVRHGGQRGWRPMTASRWCWWRAWIWGRVPKKARCCTCAATGITSAAWPGRSCSTGGGEGGLDETLARGWLDALFQSPPDGSPPDSTDWQKLACALALRGRLSVITGGPGTGKTYTTARLLALLFATAADASQLRMAPGRAHGQGGCARSNNL